MRLSNTKRLMRTGLFSAWLAGLALAGAGSAGCAEDHGPVADDPAEAAIRARIEQLTAEMADLPGELAVTRSSGPSLDDATRATLAGAAKVIHVYSDGRVSAYWTQVTEVPEEPAPRRSFLSLGGDIVIGASEELPDYILQREEQLAGVDVDRAVGLSIGHGDLWGDSTIAYTIDGSFSNPTERDKLLDAIGSWNSAVDDFGTQVRVRFVPRYASDGRNYVSFVRYTGPGCGSSDVGDKTGWWSSFSHDIKLACIDPATIHHEMAHTAGLHHEHQRSDRSSYVKVAGTDAINCDAKGTRHLSYNYRSVMHYPLDRPDACSITKIIPTGTNYRGTPADIATAAKLDGGDVQAINAMYSGKRSLPRFGPGIFYYFSPQHAPDKAVAVPGGSLENVTQLILWDRAYPDQQWELLPDERGYFELRNRQTGKCMEVYNFSTSNAGAVVQFDCWGGDNQKWIVAPSHNDSAAFDVINKLSLKALDVPGKATTNGSVLHQWTHHGEAHQRFQMIRAL
jgi:hypothetical protein